MSATVGAVYILMSIVVFTSIYETAGKKISKNKVSAFLVSLCVTLLGILGLSGALQGGSGEGKTFIEILLVYYKILFIFILIITASWYSYTIFKGWRERKSEGLTKGKKEKERE